MAHLSVDLFDDVAATVRLATVTDGPANNAAYFHDLNQTGGADRAARVIVNPKEDYRVGDHIRLLDAVTHSHTDTASVDPDIAADVDLNRLIFNNAGFNDKAAAVQIVINPNPNGEYRLRVQLFDRIDQVVPTLVLYDWEFMPSQRLADLNFFHFADKTALVKIDAGPTFQQGDQVIMRDALPGNSRSFILTPGTYDLNKLPYGGGPSVGTVGFGGSNAPYNWADRVAAVEFQYGS